MWREKPKELQEYDQLILALIGVFVGLAGLRLMMVGIKGEWKAILSMISIGAANFIHFRPLLDLEGKLALHLARRLPFAAEFGPRYLVDMDLRMAGREIGKDTGILILSGGCLRFQGLRTDIAVPKDLLTRLDTSGTQVGVLVGDQVVWLSFAEKERYGTKGSFATLSYAFGNLWIQTSAGELQAPPTEPPPKMTKRQIQRRVGLIVFWIALVGIGIYEAHSLADRGLQDAQKLLAMTFALTTLAAAATPAIRLGKIFGSFRNAPATPTLSPLDTTWRSEADFQEVATASNNR